MRVVATFAIALVLGGCSTSSSSSNEPDAASDAPTSDAPLAGDADLDAGLPSDASAMDVPDVTFNFNDCTNFDFDGDDQTAPDAGRTIVFSFHASVQQYAPRCMRIKAGQSVTWEGSFADHPLVSAGGDVPNPIDLADAGGTKSTIPFPAAGVYGFECMVHESPAEYGAILVVP